MDHERIHFGSRFKQGREARHLSLADVARVTKIPERSLAKLEGGCFEELPAEVFVRGFVRSFARAVGLDPDDMARRYGEIVQTSSPRLEVSLAGAVRAAAARAVTAAKPAAEASVAPAPAPAAPAAAEQKLLPAAPAAAAEAFTDEGIVVARKPAKPKDPSHTDEMRTLSKAILDAGRETRRLPLTLAVIILVIVATVTMSLLLNRPNHIGDGITQHSVRADAPTRA